MPKPVKDEIFGSRRTRLRPMLDGANVSVFEDFFFCTCLWRHNSNPETRYILLNEIFDDNNYNLNSGTIPFFNNYINIANILFEQNNVNIYNLRAQELQTYQTKDAAARAILNRVSCSRGNLTPSTARTIASAEVSELSQFIRKDMYRRLGSTDIDFIIHNTTTNTLIIIEEKLYTEHAGGSIGFGQYISFRELLNDGLNWGNSNIKFFLLFIPNENDNDCYYYNFLNERGRNQRQPGSYDQRRNERRIIFPFSKMTKSTIDNFLSAEIF